MKYLTYDDEYEGDNDDWNDVNMDDNLLLQKGKPSKQCFIIGPLKIDTRPIHPRKYVYVIRC